MAGIFNAAIFNNRVFNTGPSVAGVVAKRKRRVPEKIVYYIPDEEIVVPEIRLEKTVVIDMESHRKKMEELKRIKRKRAAFLLFQ